MNKIFFAHQDPKITSLYEDSLVPYFTFDSAHDGLSAIRKIRLFQPDLIVSDYHLPLLSGLTILKYIRSHPTLYPIPFLFLTDHDDANTALNFGANEWIDRRTIAPPDLINRIFYHIKINQPVSLHKLYGI
ncbi:MAG TPA: response regulator [Methylomirabilota bacterium]|jgi:DNA-binding response OmpR family regulator|nr:response regulator [Methylomirabilota bacterium]